MRRFLSIPLLALTLACSPPTEPQEAPPQWARMTFTLVGPANSIAIGDTTCAGIDNGPHVCIPLFGAPFCPLCAENKAMPDSVCADLPTWDVPCPVLWGTRPGREK